MIVPPEQLERSKTEVNQESVTSIWAKMPWIMQRVVFSLSCFLGIYLFSLIPKESRFEAQVNSEFIHFSNTEKALLLNSISNIDSLSITGEHDISLPGKFIARDSSQLSREQYLKLKQI